MHKIALTTLTCYALLSAGPEPKFTVTPQINSALDRISADSMRGNLSFLASDLLEGRDTPSAGLEIAAEFIAAQFRKAKLDPGGDDGYFQTAHLAQQTPDLEGFSLTLMNGDKHVSVKASEVQLHVAKALDLASAPVYKLDLNDKGLVESFTAADLDGNVVITEFSRGAMRTGRQAMSKVRTAKPALILTLERKGSDEIGSAPAQLLDPEETETAGSARIMISGKGAVAFYDELKPGASTTAVASVHVATPKEKPLVLHNVVAILRGSDPALKNTCVLLSAHYDHIGIKPNGEGDRIYNGANDDGSGTVSVVEIASALAKMNPHPRRSIVFVAFFGEEKGGFGSRYYARHPAIPLKDTIADINLEQVGRTDSTEGPQISNASMTGFDYSDVVKIMQQAGELTGVKIYKHPQNSDLYFAASDNVFLADKGVPAHSFSVAFNYSDYHGLGDEWQKIDYANMAKVDRTVALGALMMADSAAVPHWNEKNSKTEKYLKAWQESHTH
jgi:hypothetical protein